MIKVDPVQDRSQWGQAVLCSTGLAAAFFVALAMLCYSFLASFWDDCNILQQVGYILHKKMKLEI